MATEIGQRTQDARLQLKETIYDGITYECPTWEQMGLFNFDLAKQVIQCSESFDRLIALARGGWTWAKDFADAVKIPELSSMRIKSYLGVNESGEPEITQPLTDSIVGENVLLFDEVIDSGKTIKKTHEYLKIMGARSIRTATLCYKPHSVVTPDFYAFRTSAWVVFPHETREFIDISTNKWMSEGLSMDEIKSRLIMIGVTPEQVELYCSLIVK